MHSFAQIGIQTDTPDESSALEIVATDKGLLIPRVTLSNNLSSPSPVSSPATGLLVFNDGPNQNQGFYYWSGSQWTAVGGSTATPSYWELKGNSGTAAGANFVGTTDNAHLVFKTNNSERMRIENNGQIIIGDNTSQDPADKFAVIGNSDQDYAINAYSPYIGFYSNSNYSGFYSTGAQYGMISYSDTVNGYAFYGRNEDANGYGAIIGGSGNSPSYLADRSAAITGHGSNGLMAWGDGTNGFGVWAVGEGSLATYFTNRSSAGITASGHDGVWGFADDATGIGVIAMGNGYSTASTLSDGAGATFTGYHGAYAIGKDNDGTGLIGVGNDNSTFSTHPDGSGGAFTGYHGVYALAKDDDEGTGVIAAGLDESPYTLSDGSGGAFTGTDCGVFGYASNAAYDRYGGYFASGNGRYAYVGGRLSGTYRKILGNGSVSTIVEDTDGELVTLTCPEAPEILFQDYGIGQLENGFAHIVIDPILAKNIRVDEEHPLKVFVTLEGDCKGVYVSNKSIHGFDVKELQGGTSNVPFSWQLVATRADEYFSNEDGTIEISDNSQRFQPAPGPLPMNHDIPNREAPIELNKEDIMKREATDNSMNNRKK